MISRLSKHKTIHAQINIYEYSPSTKLFAKKDPITVPIPKTVYNIGNLSPASIYNITVQVKVLVKSRNMGGTRTFREDVF